MDFEIRHPFDCDSSTLWELLRSENYRIASARSSQIDRNLLEQREDVRGQFRRIHVVPQRTLPAALARATGTDRLSYVQEQRWDAQKHLMHWVVIPDVAADRVTCKGELTVGDRRKGTCERTIRGKLDIGLPIIGRRIERKVVEDLRRSYDATAVVLRELLEGQLRS